MPPWRSICCSTELSLRNRTVLSSQSFVLETVQGNASGKSFVVCRSEVVRAVEVGGDVLGVVPTGSTNKPATQGVRVNQIRINR